MLAYYNRSIAHFELGNLDLSLTDLDRSIQLAPRDPIPYNRRCILHSLRGDYDAAIIDATKEIELGQAVSGFTNRAVVQEKKGDYAAAVADFSEVIRREPNNPKAYCLRGLALAKTGKLAEAATDLRKGLRRKEILLPGLRTKVEEALRRMDPAS
jgi:Flp pilus assembly protein TadD